MNLYQDLYMDLDAGRLEARLGASVWESGDDSRGADWLDKSVVRLQKLEPGIELARALWQRGNFRWRHNLGQGAEGDLRRAIELAKDVGADILSIETEHDLGTALIVQHRAEEGMQLIERSYQAARRTSDVFLRVRSANNWGVYLFNYFAEPEKAATILRTTLEETRRTGSYGFTAWNAVNLSAILRRQGKLDEADEIAHVSLAAAEKINVPRLRGWALAGLAESSLWKGDVRESRRILDTAQLRDDDQETQTLVAGLLIEQARAEGRTEEALVTARAALEIAPEQFFFPGTEQQELGLEVIRLMIATGDMAEAAGVRSRMRAGFQPPRAADACLMVADGLLASHPETRIGHLRQAAEVFDNRGFKIAQLRALIELAETLVLSREDPKQVVATARRIGQDSGAMLYLMELDQRTGPG